MILGMDESERRALLLEVGGLRERVAVQEEERQRLLGEISDLREQNARLLGTVVDMKREGFNPLVPVTVPAPEEPAQLSPAFTRAILSRADSGSDLYHQLVRDAWKMMEEEGLPEERAIEITLRGGAYMEERGWTEAD